MVTIHTGRRERYNTCKSVVLENGETVKKNIVKYMMNVIHYGTPNADMTEAIEKVQRWKEDPHKQTHSSFVELLENMDNE